MRDNLYCASRLVFIIYFITTIYVIRKNDSTLYLLCQSIENQSICLKALLAAPQTEHFSGASPATVLPQTWQTK